MTQGHGGLDPRITGPASLAQSHASKQPPGIPLISDEEALRRQHAADSARRRHRWLVGALMVAAVVVSVVWVVLAVSPGRAPRAVALPRR
jgi:hypothetical protein